jgi:chromodomain-helicase-DNA-binding protein 7
VQFLCNGLEADLQMRLTTLNKEQPSEQELLETASGKLMLLGKLLTKLRSEGHKVLIFSQFKIMLNVISDYLDLLDMPSERIDGDTKGVNKVWESCQVTLLGAWLVSSLGATRFFDP